MEFVFWTLLLGAALGGLMRLFANEIADVRERRFRKGMPKTY